MLDVFYPDWSSLVAALREIRSYLRSGVSTLPDTPEQYNLRHIRTHFEEQVYFVGGVARIGLFCIVA